MANNQLTFADRERAARLFGTTSGYSQGNAPASASQLKSAQSNYRRAQGNALGGRLTQSQIEEAQRYAKSMGLNFNPSSGYYKGTKPSSSPSSAQRSAQRKAKSSATGNTISKGGAAGLLAMGKIDPLVLQNAFNPGSVSQQQMEFAALRDARDSALGIKRMNPYQFRQYEESQRQQREDSLRQQYEEQRQQYEYDRNPLGLGMQELNKLSAQGGLEDYMFPKSSQGLLGSSMTGNQSGSQMGSLMGTSALNRATGGYFS